jgi:UDP-N-acetylglucosamine 4,6-dehydratase/5-epimerase
MILVTGGSGYFARRLYELYPHKPFLAFARNEERLRQVSETFEVEIYCGDIANIDSLKRLRQRYHITEVYHLAAMKQVPACEAQPEEAFRTNVLGTQNLLDVFDDILLKMLSSDKAFEPINAYGMSKALAEKLILSRTCCRAGFVRFGNILGSTGSIFPLWIDQLKKGQTITVCRRCTRFFITSQDAVKAFVEGTKPLFTSIRMENAAEDLIAYIGSGDLKRINPRHGDKIHESLDENTCSEAYNTDSRTWLINSLKIEGLL